MKLNTTQLYEGENTFAYSSEKDDWVRTLISEISAQGTILKSPLQIFLNLTKSDPDYYLKGTLEFQVEQCCARCAENFDLKLNYPFALALVHSKTDRLSQKVLLLNESDDLDITYFEGPEIELSPLIHEQFFLSLPYQALCKKDCRGVCQTCGLNLNVKDCSCPKTVGKLTPFEILKNLKPNV